MIAISRHHDSESLPESGVGVPGKDVPDADDSKELAVGASNSDISFFLYVHPQLFGLPEREQRYAGSRIQKHCCLGDFLLCAGGRCLGSYH